LFLTFVAKKKGTPGIGNKATSRQCIWHFE